MRIIFVIKVITQDNRWIDSVNEIPTTTVFIDRARTFDSYPEAEQFIPKLAKDYFYQIEKLYKI
jgi:hypothetical protein